MNNSNLKYQDDNQKILSKHGIQDVIPKDEEYYTLDLRRGDNSDEEILPENDIQSTNPLDELNEENDVSPLPQGINVILNSSKSRKSKNDNVDENNEDGVIVGKPGHWGVDEGTD